MFTLANINITGTDGLQLQNVGKIKIFECQCDYHFRRAVSWPNSLGQLIEDTPLQLWESLGVDKIANIFCMPGSAQLNNQTNLIWEKIGSYARTGIEVQTS